MVEFAVILPVLLIIVFGIIEFSILLYDKAVITNASREGARFASTYYVDPADHEDKCRPTTQIRALIKNYISNHLISFGADTNATIPEPPRGSVKDVPGVYVWTVTVNYQYRFLVLPDLVTSITGPVNLSAVTVMKDENQRYDTCPPP